MVIINSLAVLSLTTFSLLAQNVDVGGSAQERVDRSLRRPAVSAFCGAQEVARLSDLTERTCEGIAEDALKFCWDSLVANEPLVAQPSYGYPPTIKDQILEQLETTASQCVSHYIEREIRNEEVARLSEQDFRIDSRTFDSWLDALTEISAEHKRNQEAIAAALKKFADTGYLSLFAILDQEIIVSTLNGDAIDQRALEDPPDWVLGLRDLGIEAMDSSEPGPRAFGFDEMKTSKHRFVAFSHLDNELDYPACRDELASLDCGGCVASRSDTLSLFVTWHLLTLDEANVEDATDEGTEAISNCIEAGIRKAWE